MGGTEKLYVDEAFTSNWIAPLGPNVDAFESSLETFLGTDVHVAALSSGTAAIHLALVLLGVSKDDVVICQSFTFSASANPILYQGATPVFVDSEPETWNMNPEFLEQAIKDSVSKGKKPKAVIAVNLYGMPCKLDEIKEICSRYDVPLVEDAAESLGSSYKGRPCGTFGDLGILSFNGNKIITTSGGGALVAPTSEIKEKAVFLATQARDKAPHYQHYHIGYNYRMSNVVAGIGRGQMEVLSDRVEARRANHEFYKGIFRNTDLVTVFEEPSRDYYSNHWLSCILIEENERFSAEDVRLALEEENIESRPLWKPMHMQPVFESAPFFGDKTSNKLFSKGLCLRSGSNLTPQDKDRILSVLHQFA